LLYLLSQNYPPELAAISTLGRASDQYRNEFFPAIEVAPFTD
jgi:hypothetical protein